MNDVANAADVDCGYLNRMLNGLKPINLKWAITLIAVTHPSEKLAKEMLNTLLFDVCLAPPMYRTDLETVLFYYSRNPQTPEDTAVEIINGALKRLRMKEISGLLKPHKK